MKKTVVAFNAIIYSSSLSAFAINIAKQTDSLLAKTLGYMEAKDLLGQTLEEEKKADELLTQIAESGVNYEASHEPQLVSLH